MCLASCLTLNEILYYIAQGFLSVNKFGGGGRGGGRGWLVEKGAKIYIISRDLKIQKYMIYISLYYLMQCPATFLSPGEKGFEHATDTGWYGKGVYFSEFPEYCMGYIQGAEKLLLCQVLPGKVFHCKKLIHGAPLSKGCDSHTSPDKKELVIFNAHHILPCYVVHYKMGIGEFKYGTSVSYACIFNTV